MLQQMPTGIVEKDEFSTIEAGKILFIIENCEILMSKSGKVMIKPSLRGSQPLSVTNMPHFHYFVIGDEQDPGADMPETWTKNAGRFKSFCIAANVQFDGYPVMQVVQNCIGKPVGAHIKTKIRQSKPGEDNRYDGQTEASVSKWLTPGNFQPELDSQIGAGVGALVGAPLAGMPQGQLTQPNLATPGQGTFAPPSGMPASVNPGLPPNQVPQGVPANHPAGIVAPATPYAPPAPAGPPATPGMEGGHYVPQNQVPPAVAVPGAVPPAQPVNPYAVPTQVAAVHPGVPANPTLPPGVM